MAFAMGRLQKPAIHRHRTPGPARNRVVVRALFLASPKKDATAELLQAAINFALQSRLRTHKGINVDVQSNALDLMGGKFGGMTVLGTGWRTPLQLTAHTIQVSVGELQVDQSALLFQQRVALKNIPIGSCTLTLSPTDLGNFMVHEIMKGTAAKAVQGSAFAFDPSTVRYTRTGPSTGQVLYEGNCSAGGQPHTYSVAMEAPVHSAHARHANGHAGAHHHGRVSAPLVPIRVHARCVTGARKHAQVHAPVHAHRSNGANGAHATTTVSETAQHADDAHESDGSSQAEQVVSSELSRLFSSLQLNLQGVELSGPRLRLMDQPGSKTDNSAPSLLEISMGLRLLDLPPLNMKF